jgi:hypothetical protein
VAKPIRILKHLAYEVIQNGKTLRCCSHASPRRSIVLKRGWIAKALKSSHVGL